MGRRAPVEHVLRTGLFLVGVLSAACSPSEPASAPISAQTSPLWGDLKPVVSVKELMSDLIDPAADNVFNAVSTVISEKGIVETEPKTEEDWGKVRIGAVTIVEGIYLLKIPRPMAPPGELNNSVGPDASELSPEQIRIKLEADPVLWNAKIEALRNAGLEILEIVKRKDTKELGEAGEILDQACENCHLEYWYPNEKDLIKKLDRRLLGDKKGS